MGGGGHSFSLGALEFFFDVSVQKIPHLIPQENIFPLSTLQFEGYTLKAPCNPHECLTEYYGDYMLFPRKGYDPHSSGGSDIRWMRAVKSGTDMDEILEKLKDIERFFRHGD